MNVGGRLELERLEKLCVVDSKSASPVICDFDPHVGKVRGLTFFYNSTVVQMPNLVADSPGTG